MVKTHEINLNTSTFNKFSNSDYIIIESEGISINDYILFRQVETIDGEEHVTDLYKLVQVKDIIIHQGLKDGYALLIVKKL